MNISGIKARIQKLIQHFWPTRHEPALPKPTLEDFLRLGYQEQEAAMARAKFLFQLEVANMAMRMNAELLTPEKIDASARVFVDSFMKAVEAAKAKLPEK